MGKEALPRYCAAFVSFALLSFGRLILLIPCRIIPGRLSRLDRLFAAGVSVIHALFQVNSTDPRMNEMRWLRTAFQQLSMIR